VKVKAAAGVALMGGCGWMGRQVVVAISMQAEGFDCIKARHPSCRALCFLSPSLFLMMPGEPELRL